VLLVELAPKGAEDPIKDNHGEVPFNPEVLGISKVCLYSGKQGVEAGQVVEDVLRIAKHEIQEVVDLALDAGLDIFPIL
jgi:hypothetical protein